MKTLLMLLCALAAAPASAAGAPDAKALYEQRCAFCHGADGKGDGPAGASLVPPPSDFTSGEFWKTRSAEQIREAIFAGKPGTSMIGFGTTLKKEEIDALVELVGKFKPAPPGGR